MTRETASQTAGPYLHIGLFPNAAGVTMPGGDLGGSTDLAGRSGDAITIVGHITDGAGDAVGDAVVELWQAGGAGHGLWSRTACDGDGRFAFDTERPAALKDQAPHVTLWIAARGIGLPLQTRGYFDGDHANAADPVLARVPPERRKTLVMRQSGTAWHMNIVLQGADETVFFDI